MKTKKKTRGKIQCKAKWKNGDRTYNEKGMKANRVKIKEEKKEITEGKRRERESHEGNNKMQNRREKKLYI